MGMIAVGLLGILGTAAGKYLQVQIEQSNQRAKKKEHERTVATELFEELSSMMDDQLYNLRQVYLGIYHQVDADVLQKRWDWYREILYQWNRKTNLNIALNKQYFGEHMGNQFENTILVEFQELKRQVERAYYQSEQIDTAAFEKRMEALHQIIRTYARTMIETIQKDAYGIYNPEFAQVSFNLLRALGFGK